jgi:hypothetical protein
MATNIAYSYAALVKADKNDDGTLTVYGKATDDTLDIDQQICDDSWLKNAMPEWMAAGGNVREQHSSIAAGVATEYEYKQGDGHYVRALVVDPVSVKKVETGVLKGFSIGIRSPRVVRDEKAAGGRIVGGTVVELSLVDRPANPNAKLMLAKAAENGELMTIKQGVPTPKDVFAAKSVDADGSIVDDEPVVEETVEAPVVDAPAEEVVAEEVVAEVEAPAEEVVAEEVVAEPAVEEEAAKSVEGDIVKGDIDLYNAALEAVAALIKAETDEVVTEGDSETKDIKCLLKALKHLQKWHKIEADKGELPELPSDSIDEDDDTDSIADVLELSAEGETVKMCDKCDKSLDLCMCADKSATISFNDDQVTAVIEKAVASAKTAVSEELEQLKSALKAVEAEKVELAEELTEAKKAAIPGGPVRTAPVVKAINTEVLTRVVELRNKAANETDRFLAKGYADLANDLEKSLKGQK